MIFLYALSETGKINRERLGTGLGSEGVPFQYAELADLEEQFQKNNLLVFFCAAGVVLRKIAPLLRAKDEDPPVLLIDPEARFVISLLSGHLGRANAWARRLAVILGAQPVITTATDSAGLLAPDRLPALFGAELLDLKQILPLNRRLLQGEKIRFRSELLCARWLPETFQSVETGETDLVWSDREELLKKEGCLRLRARNYCLGIGCKRGISTSELRRGLEQFLGGLDLSGKALRALASISLKKDEAAILELAEERGLLLRFYSPELLKEECGKRAYEGSAFVEKTVGSPAVACPAAVLLAAEQRQKAAALWREWLPTADPGLSDYLRSLLELPAGPPALRASWRGEGMSLALCPIFALVPERKEKNAKS